jgi:hypothetical protein
MNNAMAVGHVPLHERGSSSIEGTAVLRSQLNKLWPKYNIKKIFDAGSHDAAWQVQTIAKEVNYTAGELNPDLVALAQQHSPGIDIVEFDITQDILPDVDLLFVRDVTIHFSNEHKHKAITNWIRSNIPYLLISHYQGALCNKEIDHTGKVMPFVDVNWQLPPWNWPAPLESLWEMSELGRSMSLWHRSQILEVNK